jgi:hypothetical protein
MMRPQTVCLAPGVKPMRREGRFESLPSGQNYRRLAILPIKQGAISPLSSVLEAEFERLSRGLAAGGDMKIREPVWTRRQSRPMPIGQCHPATAVLPAGVRDELDLGRQIYLTADDGELDLGEPGQPEAEVALEPDESAPIGPCRCAVGADARETDEEDDPVSGGHR